MQNSRSILSPQNGTHERLDEIVQKHIDCDYKKPFQTHNEYALALLQDTLKKKEFDYLILDSCCGTGLSSRQIAHAHPSALVVGVDRSFTRLNKECKFANEQNENTLFLQANCEDFWRLCVNAGIYFRKHYILYPNPYPKTEHLKRRWHGHPVFPILASLSSEIELRSNWHTYLLEFKIAWQRLTKTEAKLEQFQTEKPLTLFERKYQASGQDLFKLIAQSE